MGKIHETEKHKRAFSWVQQYVADNADQVSSDYFLLSTYEEWTDLWMKYMYEEQANGVPISKTYTKNTFVAMIHHDFPTVHLPKHTTLCRCNTCTLFAKKRLRIASVEERKILLLRMKQHAEQFRYARLGYSARRRAAETDPQKYLSLIIDKSKPHWFPNEHVVPSKYMRVDRLYVETIGLIDHGNATRQLIFLPKRMYDDDSNITLNCLHTYICSLVVRPRTLYLQFDNCARENKNSYVLNYLAWLIDANWFDEILLSFMIAGHTQCDIDQMFSIYEKWLYKNSCEWPDFLFERIAQIYPTSHDRPICKWMNAVYDIKTWLLDPVNTQGSSFEHHSKMHCFSFRKNADTLCVLHCKENEETSEWHNLGPVFSSKVTSLPKLLLPIPIEPSVLRGISTLVPWLGPDARQWYKDFTTSKGMHLIQESNNNFLVQTPPHANTILAPIPLATQQSNVVAHHQKAPRGKTKEKYAAGAYAVQIVGPNLAKFIQIERNEAEKVTGFAFLPTSEGAIQPTTIFQKCTQHAELEKSKITFISKYGFTQAGKIHGSLWKSLSAQWLLQHRFLRATTTRLLQRCWYSLKFVEDPYMDPYEQITETDKQENAERNNKQEKQQVPPLPTSDNKTKIPENITTF